MTENPSTTFEIRSWNEIAYSEGDDGRKLTRAQISKGFSGVIEGEGTLDYLMTYRPDGSASFVGQELVTGQVGGREGSFVLHHAGSYAKGIASAICTVVPGSGTGALAGLQGEGTFSTGHAERHVFDFEFTVAKPS
ncbi:MAG: DUF3224 domain-containing protein [Acidobacteriota bacterium]